LSSSDGAGLHSGTPSSRTSTQAGGGARASDTTRAKQEPALWHGLAAHGWVRTPLRLPPALAAAADARCASSATCPARPPPPRTAPWAILITVVSSGVVGWVYLLATTWSIQDPSNLLNPENVTGGANVFAQVRLPPATQSKGWKGG
jgi:hypothetical protein